jgi:hypothetical protein
LGDCSNTSVVGAAHVEPTSNNKSDDAADSVQDLANRYNTADAGTALDESTEDGCGDHQQHQQGFGPHGPIPPHREIESLLFTPGATCGEFEWEAGLLLVLRQRYYLTYDALLFVSESIHEHYERNMASVQVKYQYPKQM